MHIFFYFSKNEDWGRLIPSAKPKDNIKSSEVLSYYLSEVDEVFAIYILDKVRKFDKELLDLSSESWSATLNSNTVEIFFIFDEDNADYKANISKADFIKALSVWKDFVKPPYCIKNTFDLII